MMMNKKGCGTRVPRRKVVPDVHSYQGLHIQLYTPVEGYKKRLKHVEW